MVLAEARPGIRFNEQMEGDGRPGIARAAIPAMNPAGRVRGNMPMIIPVNSSAMA
jgi:hypothetical protein